MPTIDVVVNSAPAVAGARQFGQATSTMSASAGRLRKDMLRLVGAFAGLAMIGKMTRVISEFGETMATVKGVSGATAEQFARMTEQAKALGAATRFTASEAGDGLLFLSRAGFTAEEAMTALPHTLNLAAAGALGLGTAADIASNVLSQFGMAAQETQRITDVLIATANRANTDVRQLAEALKYVGPVAGAIGMTVEETAAAIGTLGNSGIQASQAGTNLRGAFSALLGPTSKAKKALEEMGLTAEDVNPELNDMVDIFEKLHAGGMTAADAVEIFGRRNASAALILASSTNNIHELTLANKLAGEEAQEMANIMDDTLAGSLRAMKSAFEGVMIATGDNGFAGALRFLVDVATGVLRTFAGMSNSVEKFKGLVNSVVLVLEVLLYRFVALKAIAFAAWVWSGVVALKAMLVASGSATAGITAMGVAIYTMLGPIGWAAAAIGGLVAVFMASSRAAKEVEVQLEATRKAFEDFQDVQKNADAQTTFEGQLTARVEQIKSAVSGVEEARKGLEKFESFWEGTWFGPKKFQDVMIGTAVIPDAGGPTPEYQASLDAMDQAKNQVNESVRQLAVAFSERRAQINEELRLTEAEWEKSGESQALGKYIRALESELHMLQEMSRANDELRSLPGGHPGLVQMDGGETEHIAGLAENIRELNRVRLDMINTEREAALATKETVDAFDVMGQSLAHVTELEQERAAIMEGSGSPIEKQERLLEIQNQINRAKEIQKQFEDHLKVTGTEISDLTSDQIEALKTEIGLQVDLRDATAKRLEDELRIAKVKEQQQSAMDTLKESVHLLQFEGKELAIQTEILRQNNILKREGLELNAAELEGIRLLVGQLYEAAEAARLKNEAEQEAERLAQARQNAIDQIESMIQKYRDERAQLGMNNEQRQLYNGLKLLEAQADQLTWQQKILYLGTLMQEIELLKKATAEIEKQNRAKAATESFEQLKKDLQLEKELLGMTTAERERYIYMMNLEALARESNGQITQEQIRQMMQEYDDVNSEMVEIQKRINNALAQGLTNAFIDVISGAKSAKEAIAGLALEVGRLIVQELLLLQIRMLMRSMGFVMAQGGAFGPGGQISKYAQGGVVNGPTFFAEGGGNIGVMGEAGPEAIMPLKRLQDGSLGVKSDGGATRIVNVNMTVNTPNADSFRKSQRQIMANMDRQVRGIGDRD